MQWKSCITEGRKTHFACIRDILRSIWSKFPRNAINQI